MTSRAARRRIRTGVAVAVTALAVVASACTVHGGSNTSAATSTTTSGSGDTSTSGTGTGSGPTGTTATSKLTWHDCDSGFQCTTLDLPVDYAKPNGPKIREAAARLPASDPAHKIGTLFMNPGGPGGSAIELIEAIPLPASITAHFDIVGFDPRGVGRSSPLNCRTYLQKIYDDDPTIDSPQDKTTYLRDSKAFVDECDRKYHSLLPFLGTADVARDMDRWRQAVGDDKLNYVGFSYGTSIGQEYAQLFPTKVRAMVLDGVVDLKLDGLQGAEDQAFGFSSAMDAFIKSCDTAGCGLPDEAGKDIDEIIADVEKQPIPAPSSDRPAGPGIVNLALAQALYSKSLWPTLATAIANGLRGDGDGLVKLADSYLQRNADGTYPNGFEIYFAVSCLDQDFPRNPDAVMAAAKRIGKEYPRFGEGLVNDYVRCALWPTPAKPLHPVPHDTKGLPPIVVISTTDDPATPYRNGVDVAKQIPGARLVTNVGEGHTVFGNGKACIDDMVATYLVDLTPPKPGLRCQ